MNDYISKIERNIFDKIKNTKNIKKIELGVQNGESTKRFLSICKKNL